MYNRMVVVYGYFTCSITLQIQVSTMLLIDTAVAVFVAQMVPTFAFAILIYKT